MRSTENCGSNNFNRLRTEWSHSPYRSDEIEAYAGPPEEVGTRATCCIVYIRNFSVTSHDFAYCIRGHANLAKFHSGLHGGIAYNGPVLASFISLLGQTIVVDGQRVRPISWNRFQKVHKQPGMHNKIHWSYMFETARLACRKMTFDVRSLQLLEKFAGTATNLTGYPTPEAEWEEKAISADRRMSQEAKSIAIEMNLEILKKEDDDDDILYFLKNELHGRRVRLQQDRLSDEQTRLLDRFAELLEDSDDLCSPDNPDDPDNKDFESEKALLVTERNDLIKQIQYEITKPTDASDTVRSSTSSPKSPQMQVQHTPVKQDKHTPVKQEKPASPSTSDATTAVQEIELQMIQKFRNLTGASFRVAQATLEYFEYNVDDAVDFHFEDQEISEQPEYLDIKMDADPELETAIQLSLMTGSSDDEVTQCGLPFDKPTTNDSPKGRAQLSRGDAFTIPKEQERSTGNTSQRCRSHAGQTILLDPQGNFRAHVHPEPPPKSLWEQYRTMRSRLYALYYGSSTWSGNPDPLRSVPTRERAGYVKPAEQNQDDDDKTVSTVDIDDAEGYRDVEQEKAARSYQEKQDAYDVERTVDAADAEMVVELTDHERKLQEQRDYEYAIMLRDQFNAQDTAEQVANTAGSGDAAGEWAKVTDATLLSKTEDIASGRNMEEDNGSMCGNYSPAHSGHDSVIGDDEAVSQLDLDYIMNDAEENNRQNATQGDSKFDFLNISKHLEGLNTELRKAVSHQTTVQKGLLMSPGEEFKQVTHGGNIEPNSFVNLRDLEKVKGQVDEDDPERRKALFISKHDDAWDGYDSDADEMDIDGNEMVGSDADAEGDTDDEHQTVESSKQEGEQEHDVEKEKYDSPMVSKPDEDVGMDTEGRDVNILMVDEEDDVEMGGNR